MDIKIQSIHFDADDKLVEFIEGKLGKLEQFFDHIINAEVYLKVDKAESRDNKIVEMADIVFSQAEKSEGILQFFEKHIDDDNTYRPDIVDIASKNSMTENQIIADVKAAFGM